MYEFRVPEEHHIAIPRDPNILFSLAVAILGDLASTMADEFTPGDPLSELSGGVPEFWDEWADLDPDKLLGFAATFFDAYLNSRLDEEITPEFSLLAAAAYYIGHSVGSATVVIRGTPSPAADLEGGTKRLVHSILSNHFEGPDDSDGVADEVLAALRRFFLLEDDAIAVAVACANLRRQVYKEGSVRELLYADLVSAICALKVRAAARTYLSRSSDLALDAWRPALRKPSFPKELWPAQQKICDADVLRGRSVVIQMPTSAGKTRATEIIIRSAFLSGRAELAVIVAPYRSLCHDIRSDLTSAFSGEAITVTEASEAYQVDLFFDDEETRKTVLIVTPEKLLYLIRRNPDLAERIGLIIYDEGHQFEGMTRGPTYELLLSTLRMSLSPEAQTILISAVIGNADQIAEWLIGEANVVRGDGLLPTTRSIAFASWENELGQLAYVSPSDPEEREFFVPRLIARTVIPLEGKQRTPRFFPENTGPDVALYLGLHIVANGSVAVFCGRKDTAAGVARRAAELFFEKKIDLPNPLAVSDEGEIERIHALSVAHLGPDASASRAAELAILTHHGDTPQGLRLSIEHAMKTGFARFVVCTSTLAQGVNFPIKYLLVTATQQGRERILVRDFHNLIGRAGRAGMHTEGSVIFTTSSVYDHREHRRGIYGWQETKRLLNPANAEPCVSGILALLGDYVQRVPPIVMALRDEWLDLTFADGETVANITAAAQAIDARIDTKDFTLFVNDRARAIQNIAAFLAAHMTFDDDDAVNRVEELAESTLAYFLAEADQKPRLIEIFRSIAVALRQNADKDLRNLIRVSPLAPSAISSLQRWLVENNEMLEQAAEDGSLLQAVAERVLDSVTSKSLLGMSDRRAALPAFISWCDGAAFGEIHTPLAEADVRFSTRHPTVEHVVALCENGFGYDAAMVVASMADLTEDDEGFLHSGLSELQKVVKYGLREQPEIAFYEAGFADRIVASALGNRFKGVTTKQDVRQAVRGEPQAARAIIDRFPSYFGTVLDELSHD
ncbi:DEAD/DEAH box helicase [Brevundimonas sp.]|uniref:DEAD/DEAH box helicase n=1 Tax=Brevundimonas sp. TaxID=1871086 RepID=UPI003568D48B